jgi:uncharacterized repeat protein (TIGR03843 family)
MVQIWVDTDDERELVDVCAPKDVPAGWLGVLRARGDRGEPAVLVHADTPELQAMAAFDVVTNNADRKGGHVLVGLDGNMYGVDHGVSLHVEDKLRTVLWGWGGKPIDDDTLSAVKTLSDALRGSLGDELRPHITGREITALRRRADALLENPVMPTPDRRRPIPWPAF